ncbi:MAG: hypothetical protein ACK54V_09995 [Candidatus Kapaibacterium sp.]
MQSFSSPSELIDVFLDGEHTGTERSVLFSALGSSTDLQVEFEEALRIRTAALTDAASTIPPPDLTQSLMMRAGFSGAVVGAAAEAASAGSVASSMSTGFAAFWQSIVSALKIPLVTGVIGFVAGGFAFSGLTGSNNSGSSNTASNTASVTASLTASAASSTSASSSAPNTATASDNDQTGLSDLRTVNNQEPTSGEESIQGRDRESADVGATSPVPPSHTEDRTIVSTNSDDRSSQNSSPAAKDAMLAESSDQPAISSPSFVVRSVTTNVRYTVPDAEMPAMQSDVMSIPSVAPVEFSLRGTRGITQTLDSLVNRADAVNMGNVSLGIRYALSSNLQLLLEGGRENFATYVYDNTVGTVPYRVQQNIVWAAAGVRGTVDVLSEELGTALFGQMLIGASDVGALIRPMAGIQWKPDARVTLFGGVEQMVLQTKAQGTTNYGSKFSFSYGLSLNF